MFGTGFRVVFRQEVGFDRVVFACAGRDGAVRVRPGAGGPHQREAVQVPERGRRGAQHPRLLRGEDRLHDGGLRLHGQGAHGETAAHLPRHRQDHGPGAAQARTGAPRARARTPRRTGTI